MGVAAYVFASAAYKFCGRLWLSTFHDGLWQLTMVALGSIHLHVPSHEFHS